MRSVKPVFDFPKIDRVMQGAGVQIQYRLMDRSSLMCLFCDYVQAQYYMYAQNVGYADPTTGAPRRTAVDDFFLCSECMAAAIDDEPPVTRRRLDAFCERRGLLLQPHQVASLFAAFMHAIPNRVVIGQSNFKFGPDASDGLRRGDLGVSGSQGGRLLDAHAWLLDRPFDAKNFLLFMQRFQQRYSFAIPTSTALDLIARWSPHGLVDFGAGNGYLTMLLRARGCDVVAFDRAPLDGPFANVYYHQPHVDKADRKSWTTVEVGGHPALSRALGRRSLLLSYPPPGDDMAFQAVSQNMPERVIHIGVPNGVVDGDAGFHALLRERYIMAEEVRLPGFLYIDSRVQVFTRKGSTAGNDAA